MELEFLIRALRALKPYAAIQVKESDNCHRGICSMEECCFCSRVLEARAVLALAREKGIPFED